jgi:hypothetical protein
MTEATLATETSCSLYQNEKMKNVQYILDYASRDSSVGIATDYGLDDRRVEVRVSVESKFSSSPSRPDRLWGPPNLLMGTGGSFPGGKPARA